MFDIEMHARVHDTHTDLSDFAEIVVRGRWVVSVPPPEFNGPLSFFCIYRFEYFETLRYCPTL